MPPKRTKSSGKKPKHEESWVGRMVQALGILEWFERLHFLSSL